MKWLAMGEFIPTHDYSGKNRRPQFLHKRTRKRKKRIKAFPNSPRRSMSKPWTQTRKTNNQGTTVYSTDCRVEYTRILPQRGPMKSSKRKSQAKLPKTNEQIGSGGETHQNANSDQETLTTNQGLAISDNQNSLKGGDRGPTLLEDFILREKITHFDHERIPERIVHARGSGAHGYFECYSPLTKLTKAAPFASKGKITPVFVRFST